jgi:hypothetical protein
MRLHTISATQYKIKLELYSTCKFGTRSFVYAAQPDDRPIYNPNAALIASFWVNGVKIHLDVLGREG